MPPRTLPRARRFADSPRPRGRAVLARLLALRQARREAAARRARAEQEAIMHRTLLVAGLLHR